MYVAVLYWGKHDFESKVLQQEYMQESRKSAEAECFPNDFNAIWLLVRLEESLKHGVDLKLHILS